MNGHALRVWREQRGLHQAAAAAIIGIGVRSIQSYEASNVDIPLVVQQSIRWVEAKAAIEALSGEVDDLTGESEGVTGLHRNGDVATWDSIMPGGEYERLGGLAALRKLAGIDQ